MLNVKHLFRPQAAPAACYAAIVAAARQRMLYAGMGVPDTMEGRLDMLVLHVFFVLRRLKQANRMDFAQELTDAFFADIEANFRELGVSDQAVAKKMRAVEEIYYGRVKAYDAALGESPDAFEKALARNILTPGPAADASALARYGLDAVRILDEASIDAIERGRVSFA
jgi:cytochrome b pre-mRNA-processing protein 3